MRKVYEINFMPNAEKLIKYSIFIIKMENEEVPQNDPHTNFFYCLFRQKLKKIAFRFFTDSKIESNRWKVSPNIKIESLAAEHQKKKKKLTSRKLFLRARMLRKIWKTSTKTEGKLLLENRVALRDSSSIRFIGGSDSL